ncbi:MAG: nucleotide exchange factor GrpE [Gemmatimonadota bacterium]|nr:nucleotide exchange factor GrpE [Gemmatimonadota bacterium]
MKDTRDADGTVEEAAARGEIAAEESAARADAGGEAAAGEKAAAREQDAAEGTEGAHEHEGLVAAEEPPEAEDGLVQELQELQDRHLRLAAEFENYRKRTRRELAEMRVRAQADLVRRLLEVLDDLGRVAEATPDATVESLQEGIALVELKMRRELDDAGLARIEAAGKRFDPNLHEAVVTRPVSEPEEDDLVSRVFLEGYTFGPVLVRPARVEVNKYASTPEEGQPGTAEGDEG